MIEILYYIIENPFQFTGVILSIAYVALSIKQNILCWAALIAASTCNMFAYYIINLPLQVFMQIFFIATAFYGWYHWKKNNQNNQVSIKQLGVKKNIFYILIGLFTTVLLTIILNTGNLKSEYPFLDSLMFTFNIIPMYMAGNKIIESWLYFIFIDIISGVFYLTTGEYFFSFLFFTYIVFAILGFYTWRKELKSLN